MSNKKISQSHTSFLENPESKIMVVLEHMNHKMDILIEGQQGLFIRQEKLEQKIDDFEIDTKNRFTGLELDMHEVKQDVGELKTRMGRVEKKVDSLENKVSTIENTMVTKDDFRSYNIRVEKLESTVFL